MSNFKIALDDLNQDYVLDSIGDSNSFKSFVEHLVRLLEPFRMSGIEVFTQINLGKLEEHIGLIGLYASEKETYHMTSYLDRLADELILTNFVSNSGTHVFRYIAGGETKVLETDSPLHWLASIEQEIERIFLIPCSSHIYGSNSEILVIAESQRGNPKPRPIRIPFYTAPDDTKKWVLKKENFIYNPSPKHGDKNTLKRGGPVASQFYGTRETAEKLFYESIWKTGGPYFSYDKDEDKILVFQKEGNGQFHCYHVTFEQANGPKREDRQEIPQPLLDELKRQRSLNN